MNSYINNWIILVFTQLAAQVEQTFNSAACRDVARDVENS